MELLLTAASMLLLFAGFYFTVGFRAFYIAHPIKTMRLIPKDGIKQMLLSLGGTVGVGNIAGVSVALSLGGSGAVFWMWVSAFFAMALKYAEITLGMLHGGSPQYIKKALGSVAAIFFAALLAVDSVVTGAIIQSSAVSEAMYRAAGLSPAVTGIFLSIAAAVVLLFGIDLFKVSSVLVPVMSVGYAACAFAVILCNAGSLSEVLEDILANAFDIGAASSGVLGFLLTPAMRQGVVKGLFSNEAGCGTAPMAHAASKEKVPARQGLFGIFEVFVDTLFMCTITALALLLTKNGASHGIGACVDAFSTVFGSVAAPMLATATLLFAFATVISFGYYGMRSLAYFGVGARGNNAYLTVYCMAVFVGSTLAPLAAWTLADIVVSIMLLINTSAVLVCRKSILSAHVEFYSHIGKHSHSASRTRSFSEQSIKNASPMSDSEMNRGLSECSTQNRAK